MKYVIGGGVASVFLVYAILMVLGSIGGSGAIELLALLLLMALPGMVAGAFYAGREQREKEHDALKQDCLLYTSPSPRDKRQSRMPSSA